MLAGYGLSSLVRPLMGFVTAWPQVLALRFTDRLGKGVRSSPRDALLARFAPEKTRGRVYGFHRAMDHAGAVAGPLVATAYPLFLSRGVPLALHVDAGAGLIVILLILRLPNERLRRPRPRARAGSPSRAAATCDLPPRFYLAMAVITLFALGNASDAFILLRLNDLGVAAVWIPLLWSALHVVKMTSSVIGGALSDRFGRRGMIVARLSLVRGDLRRVRLVRRAAGGDRRSFLAYGLYFGLTEGVEKAWVADMAPADARGTAFGIYNAALGLRRPRREPALRRDLDARVAGRGVPHRRVPRARREPAAILGVFPCQEYSSPTMMVCTPTEFTPSPPRFVPSAR